MDRRNVRNKDKHAAYMREWRKKHPGYSSKYTTAWARANREKDRKSKKKWADENPDSVRNKRLKRLYGITLDEYNVMLQQQNGVCAICKLPPLPEKPLCVDHDHKCCNIGNEKPTCGKCVRGLIHRNCNSLLGLVQDNSLILRLAAEYLESFGRGN